MNPSPQRPQVIDADEVLTQAHQLLARDAPARADTWQRLHGRLLGLQPARSNRTLVVHWHRVSFVATTLALAVAFFSIAARRPSVKGRNTTEATVTAAATDKLLPDGWTEIDLESVGRLFASPDAIFHLPTTSTVNAGDSYTVALDRGEICAQVAHRDVATQGPFVVQAPGIRAVAIGTRFCVLAAAPPAESWVMVEEGRVRVERPGRQDVFAGAGGLVKAGGLDAAEGNGPRAEMATPHRTLGKRQLASPAAGLACPAGPNSERERCLWQQAGGSDLAAQNALYLLGVLARDRQNDGPAALSIWRAYEHRFPKGVLAVETRWSIFEELVAEHRFDEALSSSEELIKQHGDFFRVGELHLRRAEILRDTLGRPADAEAEYQNLLSTESRAALRDEALFGLGVSQERLNQSTAAQATFRRYLNEFPTGKHRAQAERRATDGYDSN